MLERTQFRRIRSGLQANPAVVLLGPRQVGKTTLALQIARQQPAVYVDLEDPADRAKIDDPSFYFAQHRDELIILDEVQRVPELFQVLRSRIDVNRREGRRNCQFLLLGSASNDLIKQSSESLAGRVTYVELGPLNLVEAGRENLNALWVGGGFPDAFIGGGTGLDWRKDFIRTYLERDIPALGSRIPAETLRRFWTMLAHDQAQLFNASQLGAGLGVKGQTAARYLDLMVDLLLVRRLQPWSANIGKRLVKSPKTFVRDSGILHALLGIRDLEELLGHPVVGGSWEGFVVENLLSVAPAHTEAYYYRTAAGAEIDLLLKLGRELWAIEIKRTTAPKLLRGFHSAWSDVQPTAGWVVYPGDEEYALAPSIQVTSLFGLMQRLAARSGE